MWVPDIDGFVCGRLIDTRTMNTCSPFSTAAETYHRLRVSKVARPDLSPTEAFDKAVSNPYELGRYVVSIVFSTRLDRFAWAGLLC